MPGDTNNDNLVAFRCPEDLVAALDLLAAATDVNRSEMLRILIEEATICGDD